MNLTQLLKNSNLDLSNAADHLKRAVELIPDDNTLNGLIKAAIRKNNKEQERLFLIMGKFTLEIISELGDIKITIKRSRFLLRPEVTSITLDYETFLKLRGILG